MPILPQQIPTLTTDDIPGPVRPWVESGLLVPLNRLLDMLRQLLNRGISLKTHVNAQVVERKFVAPVGSDWTAEKLDTPSTLSGPVLGVQVLACYTVDGAGHDSGPVGSLPSPVWREVVVEGRRTLRLQFQSGLTSGVRYRLVLLAWGS